MIHIFKSGGEYKSSDGKEYSIKAINIKDKDAHLNDDWVSSLDEVKKPKAKKVIKDDNQK